MVSKVSVRTIFGTLNTQRGFSIVEILIALSIVGAIFALISVNVESERQSLDDSLLKLESAVRFATDESILRNSLVRININLDNSPPDYQLEYSNNPQFILPQAIDTSGMSLREIELIQKENKKIDSQFSLVPEFEQGPEPLADFISIYGIQTTYYPDIRISGNVSIYFYPTGEKDSALIILNTSQEIASLSISPFELQMKREYIIFSEQELANFDESLENKTKELVDQWLKE